MKFRNRIIISLALVIVLIFSGISFAAKTVDLTFYFPVQVAGALAVLMDEIVGEFSAEHPDINVQPVYSGNYDQTMQKAITSAQGKNAPDVALLLAIDLFTLRDFDFIEEIDQFLIGEDSDFTKSFYPGFMENSVLDGKTWSIPFQRSTPIFYYNKEHFKEVGLDPENPPKTWDELLETARLLTIRDSKGNVNRWGFEDITDDTWTVQAFILQAGGKYSNPEGTISYFNSPEVKKAIEFRNTLANIERVMPRHRSYGAASQDFVAGAASMMYNSTGSLSFVKKSATFDFGVAPLTKDVKQAVPTGGGNLYIFKGIPEENKKAAWIFVKWMGQPEISARWSIGTGYIPVRADAFETDALKKYAETFPYILVARDQLDYAYSEMAFHNNSQIREVVLTNLQDILDEKISIDDGLNKLQKETETILAPFNK